MEVPRDSRQLASFVGERIEALRLEGGSAYFRLLDLSDWDQPEWGRAVAAVTNNLTHFFRDSEQLATLARVLHDTARRRGGDEALRIWSAGCSTGEEPYTLSVLCEQLGFRADILGTDVDRRALELARQGEYDAWALRHAPEGVRSAHFRATPGGRYQLGARIKRRVRWQEHNLARQPPPSSCGDGAWDVILCRNVLIYYSRSTMCEILQRLTGALAAEGSLLLGPSESISSFGLPLRMELVAGRIVYHPIRYRQVSPSHASRPWRLTPAAEPSRQVASAAVSRRSTEGESPGACESTAELLEAVVAMIAEGNWERAAQSLSQRLRREPTDGLARLSLGHLWLLRSDPDRATECYVEVVRLEPLVAEAHYFLGVVRNESRSFEAALEGFRNALFLEPSFWAASFRLGAAARRLGRHALCRAEWARSLRLLDSGQGTLPLLTPSLLHFSFIPTVELVREVCADPGSNLPSDIPPRRSW